MRLLIHTILVAIAFLAGAADAREVRARVTEGVEYGGFDYSGKHWLTGGALSISADSLVLKMKKGGGTVQLSLDNISELQTRVMPTQEWRRVSWPTDDMEAVHAALGVRPQTAMRAITLSEARVAYIEESGAEVLLLHPDLGGTISVDDRARFGLFPNIENFESAQYLRLPGGNYAVRITTYDDSGISHTSTRESSEAGIQAVRGRLGSVAAPSMFGSADISLAAGYSDGQIYARNLRTGGSLAAGLVLGTFTGLIGTGIAYFATGGDKPTGAALLASQEKGEDYRRGFDTGYMEQSRKKKRAAVGGGGLMGTALVVFLILNSN